MGQFADAFKSGQQAKQAEIKQKEREQADQKQKLDQAVEDARGWVTKVLAPVIAEAAIDVASSGTITMREISNSPKTTHEVTIAMHGKPPSKMGFIVDKNGAVHSYSGSQNTMGNVTTVGQVQVRQLLARTLEAIGRS